MAMSGTRTSTPAGASSARIAASGDWLRVS
jgi:hypothetical protein